MTQQRRALVVRGGWDGHAPEEAAELFVPFLRESGFDVVVEGSLEVYADADLMAATDLVVQCWTMGEILADELHGLRDAVAAGTGLRRLARRDRRLVPDGHRLPAARRRPVRRAPRRDRRPHDLGRARPRRAPDRRGHLRLQPALRAVLAARRRPQRRARDHHHHARPRRPVARAGHLTGRLDAPVGRRPGVRLRTRSPAGRPRAAARPHDHRARAALGRPARRRSPDRQRRSRSR